MKMEHKLTILPRMCRLSTLIGWLNNGAPVVFGPVL